jgi:hypothetical protein
VQRIASYVPSRRMIWNRKGGGRLGFFTIWHASHELEYHGSEDSKGYYVLFIEIGSGVFCQVISQRKHGKFVTLSTASPVLLKGALSPFTWLQSCRHIRWLVVIKTWWLKASLNKTCWSLLSPDGYTVTLILGLNIIRNFVCYYHQNKFAITWNTAVMVRVKLLSRICLWEDSQTSFRICRIQI